MSVVTAKMGKSRSPATEISSVSLVIPVYNEQDHLEELVRRCLAVGETLGGSFEIVLVDDGSHDASAALIARAVERHPEQVVGVVLNRNYGQHAAVMAGFTHAQGEVIVTLDADLQNPPEEIPRLLEKVADGFDVVGGVRKSRQDNAFRRFFSATVNMAIRKSTGVHMRDYGCMLRAYRRHVVQAMLQCHERSTFIPVLALTFADRTADLEVQHDRRSGGGSKYNFWRLVKLQFDLVTSMTTFPLRLLSVIGGAMAMLGVGLGLYILVMRVVQGPEWAVDGVFTLFAVLFVFVGAQFIGLGLLGEYIGRIYHDVRARPRYVVRELLRERSVPAKSGPRPLSERAGQREG